MEHLTFFLVVTMDFAFFTALFVAAFQSKPKLSRLQNILIIFLYFIIDLIAKFVVQYYISPFFSHYLIYVAVKMAIFSVLYSLITSASIKKVLFVFLLSQQSIDCAKAFMTMYRSFFEDSGLRIINYYIVYFLYLPQWAQ